MWTGLDVLLVDVFALLLCAFFTITEEVGGFVEKTTDAVAFAPRLSKCKMLRFVVMLLPPVLCAPYLRVPFKQSVGSVKIYWIIDIAY